MSGAGADGAVERSSMPATGLGHKQVALAFGGVLRIAREGAHSTQEALAERADIDRTYPSLLERGLRQRLWR
jgi:hypothetical protein